jgi:predicted lipoprotein with Yx(FWY)xxD motif
LPPPGAIRLPLRCDEDYERSLKEEMNVRILRANTNRYQVRLIAVALLAVLGLVAAGCGGSSASSAPKGGVAGASHSTSSVAVMTRKIKGLGTVLVNAKGRTLYTFAKDKQSRVTCTGSCASFWPPLKTSSMKPKVGGAAKSSLAASVKNPSGGRVVSYNKWPLYTYKGDSAAGQASGEALNLDGGKWYVISAAGTVIKHKTSSGGGGGTTTTGGGGGWG